MTWLSPDNPKRGRLAKCITLLVIAVLVLGFSSQVALGTAYEEGDDRYVLLETVFNETDWTAEQELNVSAPETISERYLITGELTHEASEDIDNEYPGLYANVSIEIQNETYYVEDLEDKELTLNNETIDWSVRLTDIEEAERENITITFTVDDGEETPTYEETDSWTGEVDIEERMGQMVSKMTELLVALFPLIVVVGFVVPLIVNLLGGVFDDLN